MQKITRIYVGNYGIDMAWYDGIVFDMTDPETQKPTDTIINLENGGGKTTLLSFIFSCFDTAQERFLKHIQNRNHRFSQYFARDGLPGVVLIEWEMPPRIAGGDGYRLVIGQVVAVKSNVERDEVDRIFFSFEARDGLYFESVPAPKLTLAPINTMGEFVRWMHDAQKSSPENFFHTRIQQDWQKNLQEERLIDLDMLQLQVNFSAQEGGIDTGFLTFHSEPEFLRKFLDLTLDSDRAASVRTAVINTCDKLRRKPFFQKRLNEMLKLQNSLTEFDGYAQAYNAAQASQYETVKQGSGLVLSLEARHRQKTAMAATEWEKAAAQDKMVQESMAAVQAHTEEEIVFTSLRHQRRVKIAECDKAKTDGDLQAAKEKLHHVKAAQSACEVNAAEAKKTALEKRADAAKKDLQPWKISVEKHGAMLRLSLYTEEGRLHGEAGEAGKREQTVIGLRKSLCSELEKLGRSEAGLIKEQAKLQAGEDSLEIARRQFIQEQQLEAEEETVVAIQRWSGVAESQRIQEKNHREATRQLKVREEDWRRQSKAAAEEAAGYQGSIEKQQQFIAEGQAEREALSQLPIMRRAAEAEIADPDSPALLLALDRLAQSSEREISLSDVRLAELGASKASIDETGITGGSRDVNEVVAGLRAIGVKSARPFNAYLAEAIPDADQARALVASNPARFLGVCVASAEFGKVGPVTGKATNLNTPVMVSVAALDPDPVGGDRMVLSASDDAAFNFEAATALLSKFRDRQEAEKARRELHAKQQRDAQSARQSLDGYLNRFGAGAMEKAGIEVTRLMSAAIAARECEVHADEEAIKCRNIALERQTDEEKCRRTAEEAERNIQTLQRFVSAHEAGRTARLVRLQDIEAELITIKERREGGRLQQDEWERVEKKSFEKKVELTNQAYQLNQECANLKYYDEQYPAAEQLAANPKSLGMLREFYRDAAQTFEAAEKDRLGLLHQQLESARSDVQQKKNTLSKNFSAVLQSDMAPYLNENFDMLIPDTQKEIDGIDRKSREAENRLAVAISHSNEFHKKNQPSYAFTSEMEMLGEDELKIKIGRAASLKSAAEEAVKAAKTAAARAKEQGGQSESEAKEAKNTARILRNTLALPELLVANRIDISDDIFKQVEAIVSEFKFRERSVESARKKAYAAFDQLRQLAGSDSLREVEPEIAIQLQHNDFDAACSDSLRLLEGIADRIGTTQSNIDGMSEDFEACVGELLNLTNSAITLLNSATHNKKVPVGAPYVGGKAVLKMRARFQEIHHEARRKALQNHLDALIATHIVPAKGPELVADALLRIHGKALGLQMLKMVPDEALQYVPVDKIQNSGGEGVVMAMFLYLIINQLRAETQAKLKKMGGGPLILDNPFAKATTPSLWKAQRLLAQAMDVQLIFATALPDYNTIAEFSRFIRLRKAGKNTKTGRWHLEVADFKLREQETFTG
jgi:hypothetical protein